MSHDDEWLDPDDTMGIWEHQGSALTLGDLRLDIRDNKPVPPEVEMKLPVEVLYYDPEGTILSLRAMHVDVRGSEGQPTAIIITVV